MNYSVKHVTPEMPQNGIAVIAYIGIGSPERRAHFGVDAAEFSAGENRTVDQSPDPFSGARRRRI
jgi:hypothetical protein